jgi:WD40 repeat protein
MRKCSLTLFLLLVVSIPLLLLGAGSGGAGDVDSKPTLVATIQVSGKSLKAFDISFVDQASQTYYLADRSNAAIDVVDARTDMFKGQIGAGLFVGVDPRGNDFSGPDGVLVVRNRHQLWAGDGDSTVKVFDLEDPDDPPVVISTGGKKRVDEMCYGDGMVLAANNAEDIVVSDPNSGPFVTFFSTKTLTILRKIVFHSATNGVEQCAFDRAADKFYLALPELNGMFDPHHPTTTGGFIAEIDPHTQMVTRTFPVGNCEPAGLDVGPHHHLIVGCQTQETIVLDATTGAIVTTITQVGGNDEVSFNPGDRNYYVAARNNKTNGQPNPVLGVIDADTNTLIGTVPTVNIPGDGSAHSVAANRGNNHIFVPLPANTLAMYNDVTKGFMCTRGCIAVFSNGKAGEQEGGEHEE